MADQRQIGRWPFNLHLAEVSAEARPKLVFLCTVFLLAGAIAFGMGFLRWQHNMLIGVMDFTFAVASFALIAYLLRHPGQVERVASIALWLCFILFCALYLWAPYNPMRLSLFFLLAASVFFLKGRRAGREWLATILFVIVSGHVLPFFDTGYSNIDILTTCLYLVGLLGILENYEKYKERQCALEQEERVLQLAEERMLLTSRMFDNALEGISITDRDGNFLEVNDAFCRITGYSRAELIGQNPRILQSGHQNDEFYRTMWETIKAQGHWRGEIWNRRKDGSLLPEILTISAILDKNGQVSHYVGFASDITLLKQQEKRLAHVAHFDALTNVPNRVLLADRLRQAMAHSKRKGSILAVCSIDLDGFKEINDALGHEAGDRVLIEVTSRIKSAIREDDTVARLGGDEFVVLLSGMHAMEECSAGLNRLLEAVRQPIDMGERLFSLGASIGVSTYPSDNQDADTLLRHADQAMHTAKQLGKNRYHLYDADSDQRMQAQHVFIKRIAMARSRKEFQLYYQPKVDLQSGEIFGAEALIRWNHPELGLFLPNRFLPVLAGSPLEIELGEWVIEMALDQLEAWHQAGLHWQLSVNISASHLQTTDFAWKLKRKILKHPHVIPGSLQIEVLETAALEDIPHVLDVFERCRKVGVNFALDDFGTGYSSLAYLGTLPVDTVKIDQSFVKNMLHDKGDRAIVQGVIALAKAFERKTVAEGVETAELYRELRQMGCGYAQGYGIAQPMPADALQAWAEQWNKAPIF